MFRETCGLCGRRRRVRILVVLALLAAPAARVAAQESAGAEIGWFDEAELSFVSTGGNSESDTLSLRNTLKRVWQRARFEVTLGGLRAESTTVSRSAVGGSAADAQLVESSTTSLTAERYYFDTRYDRDVSERWYWFAAAGWNRNEPAGIKNRTSVAAGVGTVWFDDQKARFRTDYGLTYTDQEEVVEVASADSSFVGLRLAADYWRQLTATTGYAHRLTIDQNLDDSDDLRAAMVNSLTVKMSDSLALKLSHELQFDDQPSLLAVPVQTPAGEPVGESLLIEADEVDTTLSLAVVIGF